jgi:hypothetical protein
MQRIYILLCIFLLSFSSNAQDPLYHTSNPLPCIHKTFQVYVFIVLDSLGRPVLENKDLDLHIQALNQAFEPICLSFEVCNKTYIEDYYYQTIEDTIEVNLMTSRFQKKRRINLYFSKSVLNDEENSFSRYNGIQNPLGAVVVVPANGKGLVHEMGHTFGLRHIFETKFGRETVDGKNCRTAGDFICDTPAAPPYSLGNLFCEFYSDQKDPNGQFYKAEVGNYMSHHFCAHCFFSREQYLRMAENYLNSPFKMW